MQIPFHRSCITGSEKKYIDLAFEERQFSGNGSLTRRCEDWLKTYTGSKCLLTPSGTASLDMLALIADFKPGDEVILPSYTFVATASAFALRGAVPVYVDVRKSDLNIDENRIKEAITPRTKAIVPIHYGGIAANLDKILAIAEDKKVMVIEDSAQCLLAKFKGRPLGTFGDLGTLSFHATKNVHCGEGGAVLINSEKWFKRSEVIREKGTNRSQFFRGEVDKYTWVELGSAFAPSELDAAFLLGQLEHADEITKERVRMWEHYNREFQILEERGVLRRPVVAKDCEINGHIYYVVLPNNERRNSLFQFMKERGIGLSSHYVPLHSSPAGSKLGRAHGSFENTDEAYNGLLRFPLWAGLGDLQNRVIQSVFDWAK